MAATNKRRPDPPAFPPPDMVQEASEESFPASDAPAYTLTAIGPPPIEGADERPYQEVREHPISDPATRAERA